MPSPAASTIAESGLGDMPDVLVRSASPFGAAPFGGGVIGNTAGFGPVIRGSSPCPRATPFPPFANTHFRVSILRSKYIRRSSFRTIVAGPLRSLRHGISH